MNTTRWMQGAVGLAVIAATVGCQNRPPQQKRFGDEFTVDGQAYAVQREIDAQAARGARADATLRAAHFDGEQLNTLGQQKLDLMLQDPAPAEPLVIYLDVRPSSDARRQTVVAYLKDRGLKDSQIQLESGPNPRSASSAVEADAAAKALQSQQSQGQSTTLIAPTASSATH